MFTSEMVALRVMEALESFALCLIILLVLTSCKDKQVKEF